MEAGGNPVKIGIQATIDPPAPLRSVGPRRLVLSATPVPDLKAPALVTKLLLITHVLAAIVAIGPVTVAASMFPSAVRRAPADARILHRICRVYAAVGIFVPVFGLATAGSMHVMGDAWVIVSIALTALAAAVLVTLVLPRQGALITGAVTAGGGNPARLAMYTGMFNLLWAAVTVLMIVRPGSTTGA
jgi:hypothetical protein